MWAQACLKKIADACGDGIVAEIALGIDQPRNLRLIERRAPANQTQVQTHAQPRILSRQFSRFTRRRAVHHQAGGGEDAVPVGADDRFIDGSRPAEVVGIDDKPAGGAHVEFVIFF